ncbi:uncharacterized protein [Dysidea avara]|uniref:uncharacterized protein n=1 Tax=Dysidea avara TaxID=196820 RepID=UPI00332EC7C1
MINYLVAAILVLEVLLQASCQTTSNCGEVGTIGDSNTGCPDLPQVFENFCQDVYGAIDKYFLTEDRRCIILHRKFNRESRGETFCNRAVRRLKRISRNEDRNVTATVHTTFCEGPIRGFTATLNADALKAVCGIPRKFKIGSVSLDNAVTIPITEE